MQQLHASEASELFRRPVRAELEIRARDRSALLQLPPLAVNLLRDPTGPRHHVAQRQHHERREFAADQQHQPKHRHALHIVPVPRQQLELLPVQPAARDGRLQIALVRLVQAGLDRSRGLVVCEDVLDAGLVECDVRLAEREGILEEERLVRRALRGL